MTLQNSSSSAPFRWAFFYFFSLEYFNIVSKGNGTAARRNLRISRLLQDSDPGMDRNLQKSERQRGASQCRVRFVKCISTRRMMVKREKKVGVLFYKSISLRCSSGTHCSSKLSLIIVKRKIVIFIQNTYDINFDYFKMWRKLLTRFRSNFLNSSF